MIKTPRPKAGDFRAVCKLTELQNVDDLDSEVVATQRAAGVDLIYRKGESLLPIRCSAEFVDKALFEAHEKSEHGRSLTALHARHDQHRPYTVGRWRGLRLTEDGFDFEPSGLDPGATITWSEYVGTGTWSWGIELRKKVERSGQVWSLAWRPKSAWVVPFERFEGEAAVMVERHFDGTFHHYSTESTQVRVSA